jgi:predicted Rossmann fold flavoprotein
MKIAIIGAGAAGCFAAANIPFAEGREVIVFERSGRSMQKVKVSGGGRCNVTHACFEVNELVEKYPRGRQLLRKTFYQFGPSAIIDWFSERGVLLKTEPDKRMFPVTDDSQTIIDCIWQQMMKNQVKVHYHKIVNRITQEKEQFHIHFADNTIYVADKVLIATGGYPKPEQYQWLEAMGHSVQPPVPSLFTFNITQQAITELMGVSANVTIKIAGTKFVESGPLLITHWGFSGPAVLRMSAWAARELQEKKYDFKIAINWLQSITEPKLKEQLTELRRNAGKKMIWQKNPFDLPKRLWEYLLTRSGIKEEVRWGELNAAGQNKLVENLVRDIYNVKGKTTFKEEFVTCGGITLSEINPQTMESRKIPGLYFAGEVTDVDGITGGFNFQNAWSSGWIAAKSLI